MAGTATTHEQILDLAQRFIQERGYNGFSFRDLANGVGVKSSSIHYYYASKTHLALAVTSRYRKYFTAATAQLRKEILAAPDLLRAYAQIFKSTLEDGKKVCLCAMLASDRDSVEDSVTDQVREFFADQHRWLSSVVTDGISQGTIRGDVCPDNFAVLFFSALEGAMMVANANDNSADIELVANQMIGLVRQAP